MLWKISCRLTDTVMNIGNMPVVALASMNMVPNISKDMSMVSSLLEDTDTARLKWDILHSKEGDLKMSRTTSNYQMRLDMK